MSEARILTVPCGNCASRLKVKTHHADKVVTCPKCKAKVTVSPSTVDTRSSGHEVRSDYSFACPNCASQLETDRKAIGTVMTCSECEQSIRVPAPPGEELDSGPSGALGSPIGLGDCFHFKCPQCQQAYRTRLAFAGKAGTCAMCKLEFRAPTKASTVESGDAVVCFVWRFVAVFLCIGAIGTFAIGVERALHAWWIAGLLGLFLGVAYALLFRSSMGPDLTDWYMNCGDTKAPSEQGTAASSQQPTAAAEKTEIAIPFTINESSPAPPFAFRPGRWNDVGAAWLGGIGAGLGLIIFIVILPTGLQEQKQSPRELVAMCVTCIIFVGLIGALLGGAFMFVAGAFAELFLADDDGTRSKQRQAEPGAAPDPARM